MNKQPEITAQTRQKLIEAFWQIYGEKGIKHTTVGAVAKSAGYNRSTFYEYFTDIYDLLEQLEDDLLKGLKAEIAKEFQNGIPKDFQDYSRMCAHIFVPFDDKLYVLLSSKGDPSFPAKLQKTVKPLFFSFVGFKGNEEHLDYIITFGFSAMTGLLSHWYEEGKKLSTEELFRIMQALIATGVLGYTGKQLFH
ncbi:TetR/AcrR family transcriptional regulator [Eubacterium sp. 1001713B170207_170306_E7]|uniref:TetR/AcrR family transcriptional regulator n=1 Tax=Eubacterium sp. 1001713B170207_170306_E7 TaxID=2787097 RepID=UPI001899B9F6|nr:TetR/AcrR family transcriptional regulator [Eubacterium sp. 1001713B170207_170306_E7]